MSRYTAAKARINRRLGAQIFESKGALRAFERRQSPPGMAFSRGRKSGYGESMREKQKVKYYYGMGERQLRRLFSRARRQRGNTGENLLALCERRLDNVVRRAGFAKTRPQARQGVSHGHFLVNGRRTDIPSYEIRVGDVIEVKDNTNLKNIYREIVDSEQGEVVEWLVVDPATLKITITGLPTAQDSSLPVEIGLVVELLSR